ncbi:ECF RNA polymerase sigma factor SigJ [Streptomyces sp. MBT84]|uniref:sigma factor n=1 Tax=Streptomyces sp. MBT84 TaxID=1488414 RepID=UPI001C6F0D14|nr:sigma factor [Streptomyces sp. MBT84]MBW8699122.1 ECF RNA polymerase sigma factor SigJ [Streptomyces sp. MBT84]
MSAPSPETTTPAPPPIARSDEDGLSHALEVFLAQRTRLFRISYRMLGDASRAEDVVQEVWLRWQLSHRATIENPAAFLTTATTRLAINVIQSGWHRHETPAEWQSADIGDPSAQDPVERAEQAAALEAALDLLMARLTPDRVAAYVLRKGFGYAYAELAELLRITVPHARVMVHRAQARLECDRERPVADDARRRLVTAFRTAAGTGDMEDLVQLLVSEGRVHRLLSSAHRSPGPARLPAPHAV